MSKKYIESELNDRCADVIDVCSAEQYQQMFLACTSIVLNIPLTADEIEWDNLAEREKFEPADTN